MKANAITDTVTWMFSPLPQNKANASIRRVDAMSCQGLTKRIPGQSRQVELTERTG